MLTIGLTGGIGCGKSTVSDLFSKKGVTVIDADEIAHQLVEPHQPTLTTIKKQFGDSFITEEGALDRNKLRDFIYNDPEKKAQLENILHPLVYTTIERQYQALDAPYVILSIPLLFETQYHHSVDRILVVDCSEALQIERVTKRNGLTTSAIKKIMASQCSRSFRVKKANDIIHNGSSLQHLKEQVQKLHETYMEISASKM